MKANQNYQKELEKILANLQKEQRVPTLLLHSCCAPCSSYVLEYLSQYFSITIFYFNPNISPKEEYQKRVSEQKRLIAQMPFKNPVSFCEGEYQPSRFFEISHGLETVPEGGERCFKCYALRLNETAEKAAEENFDFFTTTLTISPLKNASKLNEIGQKAAKKYGVAFLPSDFKKREGFKRSIELSRQYKLYRQDYCGCIYSKSARLLNTGNSDCEQAALN